MNIIRQRLIYTGQVQGVGFRYRAKHVALKLGVTGWVHNEWDGRVTMEAQGTIDQINELMKLINQSPLIYIDWVDRINIPLEEGEKGFHTR